MLIYYQKTGCFKKHGHIRSLPLCFECSTRFSRQGDEREGGGVSIRRRKKGGVKKNQEAHLINIKKYLNYTD